MRQYFAFAPAVILVLSGFGCTGVSGNDIPEQARTALEQAAEIELVSLDPEHLTDPPPDAFHGWKVLGKTVVKDAKTRQELIDAFERGIRDSDGTAAACFDPRHGIRVTYNDTTVSFVICFECLQVQVYLGDERQPDVLITDSPEPIFDRILTDAGVPLAEKSEQLLREKCFLTESCPYPSTPNSERFVRSYRTLPPRRGRNIPAQGRAPRR